MTKINEKLFVMTEMLMVLTVVMVSQVCTFVRYIPTYQIVHCKQVLFMVCLLYLNKAV